MIKEKRLKELCNEYYNDVYRYCFSQIHDVQDSKDLTQEVFALFVEKASELDDENIKAWLFSVAAIKIKQTFKDKVATTRFVSYDCDTGMPSGELDSIVLLDILDVINRVDDETIDREKEKIISVLTDEEKELYNDVYLNNKKYKEIAKEKGMNIKTISVKTYRLREKIKAIAKNSFPAFLVLFLSEFLKILM